MHECRSCLESDEQSRARLRAAPGTVRPTEDVTWLAIARASAARDMSLDNMWSRDGGRTGWLG
jgi:hypothetical protein